MNISELRNKLEQAKGRRQSLRTQLKNNKEKVSNLEIEIDSLLQAQLIIQKVAKETQEQLEWHISNLVTLALESIFPNPYKFNVKFIIKRGQTECALNLIDDQGNELSPLDAVGGGVIDVSSFALRIALWTLTKSRNTMTLDEPFKFVSKSLLPKVAILLKELSQKLKLQMIIVSHLNELVEEADKVFQVTIKNGVSNVIDECNLKYSSMID